MRSTLLSDSSPAREKKYGLGGALQVASFLALLGVSACTSASIGINGSCDVNTTLSTCSGSDQGWTCTGNAEPEDSDSDLVCNSIDSTGDYCCATSASCSYAPNVSCGFGQVPYTCTTGSNPPQAADSSLACGAPVTANGVDEYCCYTTTTSPVSACSASDLVTCANGSGWVCTGSSEPEDTNPDLVCSTDGAGDFCCATSACSYDGSVPCAAGTSGYSCATGATPPDQNDPSLVCSSPTTANGVDQYCCFTETTAPPATSTCEQDQTVTGCLPDGSGNPSYGFSCIGTESPATDFAGITCSSGGTAGFDAQGVPATLYCCVFD